MRNLVWAKALFESYKYMTRIIKSIDRMVLERSVKSYGVGKGEPTTMEKMEIIIDLIQRKKRLLTIKMLIEEALKNMDREDARVLIDFYIDKIDIAEIAEAQGKTPRTMLRHINKMLLDAMTKISDLGYDINRIELLLKNEGWIVGVYNKIASRFGESKRIPLLNMPNLLKFEQALFRSAQ